MSMFGQPMDQPRQLILESAAGIAGNGIATIGGDNSFSLVAHLPQPSVLSSAPSVYAVYLVDAKGSNGFCAGTLSSAGSGMYQLRFRSQVPLVHYDKVIISLENPQAVMHYPQGPILLQVKPGFLAGMGIGGLAFLEPLKKVGGTVFGRAAGFVRDRAGGIWGHKQEPNQIPNQIQDQDISNQIQSQEQINNQGRNQNLNPNQIQSQIKNQNQYQYQYQGRNQYRNPYQNPNQYQYQNQKPFQNQGQFQRQQQIQQQPQQQTNDSSGPEG